MMVLDFVVAVGISSRAMDLEGYKNVLVDGLPREDGAYLVVLKGETGVPRLFVRFTQEDGSRFWVSAEHKKIAEEMITLYKRILITPDRK